MGDQTYDVLCFGPVCADLRMRLPRLPAPGEGMRVREARWEPGGNSLIEARALVGWGVRVALLGDALGYDAPGEMLAATLRQLGLDALLRRDPAAQTVVCHVLITPDGQRAILALRPDAPPPALPPPALLHRCRIVSVTRYGPGSAELAASARAAGCIVVAGDATDPADELARHADVIVTSADLLARERPAIPVAAQIQALHAVRGAAILASDGPRPARALWAEQGSVHQATFTPPVVHPSDTTGAGDIFRAAVVRGLLQATPWPHTLAQACAAASSAIAGR